jgi:hypothetical protein
VLPRSFALFAARGVRCFPKSRLYGLCILRWMRLRDFLRAFGFGLHAFRFPAIQLGVNDCLVMTNSNFIEIPNSEGQSGEFINADDIASFDYSPAMAREAEIPVESAITVRLKNGKSVVCRGQRAEALRAKLTEGC